MAREPLSDAERRMLAAHDRFIHGAEVRVARRLEARGYLVLTDNGYIPLRHEPNGRPERWSITLTESGKAALRSLAEGV